LLGYWDLRGLGEPIRLMLEHAGADYVEKKYQHYKLADGYDRTDWHSVKFSLGLAYPNLPYLIDGDVKVTESWAIMKYLSRKFEKLGPENEEERIKCDVTEGVVQDFRQGFTSMCYNPDFESLKTNYLRDLPGKLEMFEKNLSSSGWLAGPKITYVDFAFCETLDEMRLTFPGCFDKHPNLLDYLERFNALEKIASYKCSDRFHQFPVNGKMAAWIGEAE
uniref:glutathione transferase n=1 Tax=Ciona intestinalis TaxID=7719 RepID=F7AHC2_CIOIN